MLVFMTKREPQSPYPTPYLRKDAEPFCMLD